MPLSVRDGRHPEQLRPARVRPGPPAGPVLLEVVLDAGVPEEGVRGAAEGLRRRRLHEEGERRAGAAHAQGVHAREADHRHDQQVHHRQPGEVLPLVSCRQLGFGSDLNVLIFF